MRILKKNIELGGEGFIHLIPEQEEDLFYVYNLILVGDDVRADTFRKIKNESKTGSVQIERKRLKLTLRVLGIDYVPDSEEITIKGKNLEQNEFINVGQHHNFKLELNQPLVIMKREWEKYHLELLKESMDVTVKAELAAMVMDEGVAHLCYVKNNITTIKDKVESNIPKKKSGSENHSKSMKSFYGNCLKTLSKVDFSKIKAFVLASPGFVKEEFLEFIKDAAQKEENKALKPHLSKFMLVKCSNGYKDALTEVLNDPKVANMISDTKAIIETKVLEKFYETMSLNSEKITYGPKHVLEANSHKAIDTLLISDQLLRSRDFALRKIFNDLIASVVDSGGNCVKFSSTHSTGERLNSLSGIAAILRFPLNLDYLDEDDEELKSKGDTTEEEEEKVEEIDMTKWKKDLFDDF